MDEEKGFRSRFRSQNRQTRRLSQNLAAGHTWIQELPSSNQASTAEDNLLSAPLFSTSAGSSISPSFISPYYMPSPSTLSPRHNNEPSMLNFVTALPHQRSPALANRFAQLHPSQQPLPLISHAAPITDAVIHAAPPNNTLNYGANGAFSWREAHLAARPGLDVDWQTYLTLEWPPSGPDAIGNIFSSYGMIRCGSCKTADATFDTREGWFAHLNLQHPLWIRSPSAISPKYWHGIASCAACSSLYSMHESEESWWVHVWMAHPEWNIWVPSLACFLGCSECTFQNKGEWLTHLWTNHHERSQWVPRHCMWEDCGPTGGTFKSSKEWLNHVGKKHQKSRRCEEPPCNGEQPPFGSQPDLDRHHKQKHLPPIFCDKPNCPAKRKANIRRPDKKEEHDCRWHGSKLCSEPKCPRGIAGNGFSTEELLKRHIYDHRPHHPGT